MVSTFLYSPKKKEGGGGGGKKKGEAKRGRLRERGSPRISFAAQDTANGQLRSREFPTSVMSQKIIYAAKRPGSL